MQAAEVRRDAEMRARLKLDWQRYQESAFIWKCSLQQLTKTGVARSAGTEHETRQLARGHEDGIPSGGLAKRAGVALRTVATSHVSPHTETRFPDAPRPANWTTATSWSPGSRLHVPGITFPGSKYPVVTMQTRRLQLRGQPGFHTRFPIKSPKGHSLLGRYDLPNPATRQSPRQFHHANFKHRFAAH